jgi:hypothetical protein
LTSYSPGLFFGTGSARPFYCSGGREIIRARSIEEGRWIRKNNSLPSSPYPALF